MKYYNNSSIKSDKDVTEYYTIYIISQVFGLVFLLALISWVLLYQGGYGFSLDTTFSWHFTCMSIGFIYLFSNSILYFRTFRNKKKSTLKYCHSIFNVIVLLVVLIGTYSVLTPHFYSAQPSPYFTSLHSWVGISTILLFLIQLICGIISFLYPGVSEMYKTSILPYHMFFGLLTFGLAVVTVTIGISEQESSASSTNNFIPEGVLLKIIGLLVLIYASMVAYLATKPEYKRIASSEQITLLTGTSN
ncbi:transmembrane ascorbate-dependent reductase CYB561-like [Daktulosphaira vitifoliae]|uniref:transmembrane ascorbate-dependent reductase CYB561-like n=1 Tax=Daktulosphaira vitifoliae TaxID=58002 RepID=UPI0021AA82A3|nr:transmembrane ascorbate-dependent reductase CYB561-like [Daktulosphaira vitifoliae]XP_050544168.1 transmembrane ascorbate-dependent reductase CYB561-like [Daktulosphaira vitifoliae]XP_050544169.1 transmembrane ascorbate-dependent reductase CYB561-like [Daktulosphaira vitifoliae]XP_050544170.1 transmembrane ascorbate-dependent reductase CYB561-like [Daktulosphaira vitifoliae]